MNADERFVPLVMVESGENPVPDSRLAGLAHLNERAMITSICHFVSRGQTGLPPRASRAALSSAHDVEPTARKGSPSQVPSTLPPSPSCSRVRPHSCHFHRTHIHIVKQRPSFVSKKNNSLTEIPPAFTFFLHSPYYHPRVQRCSQPPHDPPYPSQG